MPGASIISRFWTATVPLHTWQETLDKVKLHYEQTDQVLKYEYAEEESEGGYEHVHLLVNTRSPRRLGWLRQNIGDKFQWQPCKDVDAFRDYIRKQGIVTSVGNWIEMPGRSGSSSIESGLEEEYQPPSKKKTKCTNEESIDTMFRTVEKLDTLDEALAYMKRTKPMWYYTHCNSFLTPLTKHFKDKLEHEKYVKQIDRAFGTEEETKWTFIPERVAPILEFRELARAQHKVLWIWGEPRIGKSRWFETNVDAICIIKSWDGMKKFKTDEHTVMYFDDLKWQDRSAEDMKMLLDDPSYARDIDQKYHNLYIPANHLTEVVVSSNNSPKHYISRFRKTDRKAIEERLLVLRLKNALFDKK